MRLELCSIWSIMRCMNFGYELRKLRLYFLKNRSLLIRIFLCWILGLLTFFADQNRKFDTRLDVRGLQKYDDQIVIIRLKKSDFKKETDLTTEKILKLNDFTELNDAYFWDQETWKVTLEKLLESNVKHILVTLFFADNIGSPILKNEDLKIFNNKKIIWSADKNYFDKNSMPIFALADRSNIGSLEFVKDEDGILRRVYVQKETIPHIVEKMNTKSFSNKEESLIINFLGKNIYPEFSLSDILNDSSLQAYLKNKIIIIGTENPNSNFLTPVGFLSKAEIVAHIADNARNSKWVRFFPLELYFIYFLFLVIFTIAVMLRYPPQISILIVMIEVAVIASLSAATFDVLYFWIPFNSSAATVVLTWIVFIGHQSMKIEESNAKLKIEKQSREELEQLKNNFVSLISHDLKTPIAKIQAVIDRLLGQSENLPLKDDLLALRNYNDELNKYIQSIIKVLRVESRDFKLNKEVVDLNELIVKAVDSLKPLAQVKNIKIELNLEPLFSQELDSTLIQEVIINLIENAIKYSPDYARIFIHSWEENNFIHLMVKDNGPGIPQNEQNLIFEKFFRGQSELNNSKGTGLGLYLVKYFIELHRGRIDLRSELGQGTQISFSLPLDEMDEELNNNFQEKL
jgi:two-component system phosphate regulon sensor histidine kinase PhoR